jgi:hypothetical protein
MKELDKIKKKKSLKSLQTISASGGAEVGKGEFSAKQIRVSSEGGATIDKVKPSPLNTIETPVPAPLEKSMPSPAKDANKELQEGYEKLDEITKKARGPASTKVLDMSKSKSPMDALKALEPKSVVRESELAEALKKKKAK